MSQVEELLNSVAEVPVHTHPVPDTDTYFIIDPITRAIENTTRKKNIIMQYDHNSERFTFELPRYIDGHDMLECTSVTVNVDNIEAETGTTNSDAPDMTDLRIHPNDPEKVISSWLITRNSTQLAGNLSFHIEYKCADSNGNVVYEWATDSYDEIQVKARKKNGEAAVIEHTDLLEQWRASIFGAGDSVMANIESEGKTQVAAVKAESEVQQEAVELKGANTLKTIPEDYTNVNNMAEEAMRTKTDAIVLEASGESITLKDSSNDHIRGLKLFGKSTQFTTTGKNLFKTSFAPGYTETIKGVTVTVNPDKSIHIKGTPTAAIAYNIFEGEVFATGNYFISGAPSTSSQKFRLQVNLTVDGTEKTGGVDMGIGSSFSVDETVSSLRGYIYVASDAGEVDGTFYPQIEVGAAATDYEPYTGGIPSPSPEYPQEIVSIDGATVTVTGKNLLNHQGTSKTMNGVTFTVNADKSIHVHGTATGSTSYYLRNPFTLPKGSYIMSGCPTGGSVGTYRVYYSDNVSKTVGDYGQPAKFTLDEEFTGMVVLQIYSGAVIDNLTFYPMIRPVAFEDESYEPYVESQSIIADYTIPGIPVTSGGNYTDSDGQQWICDEIDLERGVRMQKINTLALTGGESIANVSGDYAIPIGKAAPNNPDSKQCLCNYYPAKGRTELGQMVKFENQIGVSANLGYIRFADTLQFPDTNIPAFTDFLAEKHAAGNPVTVAYVLAKPVEKPLTAEEIAAFKALRTNYPNTTILNDAGAWMNVKYNADTKTYIDEPKVLKLVDSSTGVVYELKIVDGTLSVVPVS